MAAQPNIVSVDAAVTNRDSILLPMFNFPEDKPRTMSAAELIAILKYNNRRHEDVFGEVLKPKKTKEECVAEFLDLIVPDKNHKRVILRSWPRSPTGAVIRPTNSLRGKETPNGIQLWGQTMLDFFHVRRLPQTAGAITTTTGSKMLRWVKENGELDWAKEQIEWAENEEDPKIIEPYPMLDYIRQQEDDIRMRIVGEPMSEESEEDADLKVRLYSIFVLIPLFTYGIIGPEQSYFFSVASCPIQLSYQPSSNFTAASSPTRADRCTRPLEPPRRQLKQSLRRSSKRRSRRLERSQRSHIHLSSPTYACRPPESSPRRHKTCQSRPGRSHPPKRGSSVERLHDPANHPGPNPAAGLCGPRPPSLPSHRTFQSGRPFSRAGAWAHRGGSFVPLPCMLHRRRQSLRCLLGGMGAPALSRIRAR